MCPMGGPETVARPAARRDAGRKARRPARGGGQVVDLKDRGVSSGANKAVNKKELTESLGAWLSQWPWDWFATLTFRDRLARGTGRGRGVSRSGRPFHSTTTRGYIPPSEQCSEIFFRQWIQTLEQAVPPPLYKGVGYFRAVEFGKVSGLGQPTGRIHFHALLCGVKDLSLSGAKKEWEKLAGWARILRFDPTRGAAYYVSKYCAKELGDFALSDNLGQFVERMQ